jgi:hypothetical protein
VAEAHIVLPNDVSVCSVCLDTEIKATVHRDRDFPNHINAAILAKVKLQVKLLRDGTGRCVALAGLRRRYYDEIPVRKRKPMCWS